MSLRSLVVVAMLLAACSSGAMKVHKGEPQTAREKMLAEEKAHPPDKDEPPPPAVLAAARAAREMPAGTAHDRTGAADSAGPCDTLKGWRG